MVETMEKHFGQIIHRLPVFLRQVAKLVEDKVGNSLGNAGFLKRRIALQNIIAFLTKWFFRHLSIKVNN